MNGNRWDWDGWDCEGAVAAVLWDLFDSANQDHPTWSGNYRDTINYRWSSIWHVFTHKPNNMQDVYNSLVSHYPGIAWINALYIARMNPNNYYDT